MLQKNRSQKEGQRQEHGDDGRHDHDGHSGPNVPRQGHPHRRLGLYYGQDCLGHIIAGE